MGDNKPKSYNTTQIENFNRWLKRSGYILTSLTLMVGAAAILIARVTSNVVPQAPSQAASSTEQLVVTPTGSGNLKNSVTGVSLSTLSGTVIIMPPASTTSATAVRLMNVTTNQVVASGVSTVIFDTRLLANGTYHLSLIVSDARGTQAPAAFTVSIVN